MNSIKFMNNNKLRYKKLEAYDSDLTNIINIDNKLLTLRNLSFTADLIISPFRNLSY